MECRHPLAENYYSVSPYAFCSGNPVNFVDSDGEKVFTADEVSRNNIKLTLSEEEAKYVKFKPSGELKRSKLNRSKSKSENMTALKALSNSKISYVFSIGTKYTSKEKTADFVTKAEFVKGITLIPNAVVDSSPDNNVYIITNSELSEQDQVLNVAHEAYGHAYFYELQQQGYDVNPFHDFKSVNGEEIWLPEFQFYITASARVDTNKQLVEQINNVTKQALENYKKTV